jgi:hypothetical protein
MSVCDEAGMPSDVPANQAERIPGVPLATGSSPAVTLISAHIARSSPAWPRLSELSQEN